MEPELLRRDVHPAEVSFADGRVLLSVLRDAYADNDLRATT